MSTAACFALAISGAAALLLWAWVGVREVTEERKPLPLQATASSSLPRCTCRGSPLAPLRVHSLLADRSVSPAALNTAFILPIIPIYTLGTCVVLLPAGAATAAAAATIAVLPVCLVCAVMSSLPLTFTAAKGTYALISSARPALGVRAVLSVWLLLAVCTLVRAIVVGERAGSKVVPAAANCVLCAVAAENTVRHVSVCPGVVRPLPRPYKLQRHVVRIYRGAAVRATLACVLKTAAHAHSPLVVHVLAYFAAPHCL